MSVRHAIFYRPIRYVQLFSLIPILTNFTRIFPILNRSGVILVCCKNRVEKKVTDFYF